MCQTMIEEQRLLLQSILSNIEGVKRVYYQPPSIDKLIYPCIIYTAKNIDTNYSNGHRYLSFPSYELILIDYDPDSIIHKYIMDLNNGCHIRFDRFYTADNLNHWVYELVFSKKLW